MYINGIDMNCAYVDIKYKIVEYRDQCRYCLSICLFANI